MNPDKLTRRIIEYSFYALLIIVPLILTPYNYELFEFNKMLTVYLFTTVIAAAWISRMIINRKLIFTRTPFDIPILLFLLSQIVSTILSIDPHTSFWGYYSRFHGGLLSTMAYITLYYAYVANMEGKTKNAVSVMLTTAVIVAAYGILERLGIDKSLWVQDVQNRVFSTIGQPNWLAAYLLVLIPLFISRKSWLWRGLSLVPLAAIWFTRSRSGYLALAVALTTYLFLLLVKKFSTKLLLLPLAALLIFGLFNRQYLREFFDTGSIRRDIETENQTRLGGSSSVLIRRVVWRGALEVWRHYPVFGSGVETFAYSYYNFRPAEHNLLSEWDYLYNKAHNEFLNFLATTGAVGLAAYLILIITFLCYSYRRSPELAAGFIGMAVSNFLGFSVVPVALFFFLFPALALNLPKPGVKKQYFFIGNTEAIGITLVSLAALFLIVKIGNWWLADKQFNYGKNYVAANQIEVGYRFLSEAVERMPGEPLFRNDLAETQAKLAVLLNAANQATLSAQLAVAAVAESDKVITQNPVNLNFYKTRVNIFRLVDSLTNQHADDMMGALLKAIELAPTDAKLRYNLGLIYNQLGQTGLAQQAIQEAIDLKPNYDTAIVALETLKKDN